MNAYNPLDSMKRLETAGRKRRPTEAITNPATALVTKDLLAAAPAKQTIRIGILTSGIVAVATGVLGVLISLE